MIGLSSGTRIFLYSGATDMRKSFDGLSGLVAQHFNAADLLKGDLFLFFNRRRDCIKILYWDRDGLALWYKRLEAGSFQIDALGENDAALEIDPASLSMLLSGIDLSDVKRRKRYRAAA